jgi:hypothetical protein
MNALKLGHWLAAIIAVVLAGPLAEELVFRGVVPTLFPGSGAGWWVGATLGSAIWAMLHFDRAPPIMLGIFIQGLMLSWMVRRTGSLWTAVLAHVTYNGLLLTATLMIARASKII